MSNKTNSTEIKQQWHPSEQTTPPIKPPIGDPKKPSTPSVQNEIGGPAGLEPTRFGDWEKNGRCSDF